MKTQYVQKADNRKQNATTKEAATVVPLVVHDVPTTSEALNEITTTEATQVIISDPPTVADIPPPSTVTLPSVVRASPEPMCSDLVPAVTGVDSTATTSTPLATLGPLSNDLVPHVGMTAGEFIFCEVPVWDPYCHQGQFYRSSSWQTASSCDSFPDIPST